MFYVAMPMQNLTTLGQPLLGDYLGGGEGKEFLKTIVDSIMNIGSNLQYTLDPYPPKIGIAQKIQYAHQTYL